MKPCTRCQETKPLAAFGRDASRKDGRQHYCRPCRVALSRPIRARNYALVLAAKAGPCLDCGGTFHPVVMDLDHRPGEVKVFDPSKSGGRRAEVVAREVAKCDPVCANCHRIRTFTRNGVIS